MAVEEYCPPVIVRSEKEGEDGAIRAVTVAAFDRPDEARLVDRLRCDGDAVLSLVAIDGDKIVGHVLFSRVTAPFRALGLGPVSVLPERQRTGIGNRLIRTGIERARQTGWQAVFVLGHLDYYPRFGFDPALAAGFTCRYAGPHFMILPLAAALSTTVGGVDYAPAFRALG
jgi:putative acetyltransferase